MNALTSANWCPTIFILLCGLHKAMVIPAKAGIQWGGDGKCSAGACPPLGLGRGRIRCAKSRLRLFFYLGAPSSGHEERLVRK